MNTAHAILSAVLIVPVFLVSQTDFIHSLPPALADSNRARIGFERNINTYNWNFDGNFFHHDTFATTRIADRFTSSLIQGSFVSFRDENTFGMSLSHDLSQQFALTGEAQSYVLSDNQSLDISKAGVHTLVGGISYKPLPNIFFTPMAGIRYDVQQGKEDNGFNYNILFGTDTINTEGYRASMNGQLNQSDLHPRRFGNNNAQISVATDFSEESSDSLRVRWSDNRWDFYIPADSMLQKTFGVTSNIRTRSDRSYGFQNYLQYNVGNGFFAQLRGSVESRSIDNNFRYKILTDPNSIQFNTTVQQFTINGGGYIRYLSRQFSSMVGMEIGERDEKHLIETIDGIDHNVQLTNAKKESRLDNTGLHTTVRNTTRMVVSSADTVLFNGSIGLFRYDTPDSLNTDDRDEQSINASFREMHRFNESFSASLTAEVSLTHVVYLYKDKSANNNWNRIFRLSPELLYTPSKKFRMYNAFEVLANYTVFDFEFLIPSVQSYSFRQVAFLDSTSYDITQKVQVGLLGHVRIYERGELHWDEFSERPQQYVEEVTFSPEIRYYYHERWYFAAGFRSFAQKRFSYVGTNRVYDGTFLSAGPTTHIAIRLSPRSQIEIKGWKEFQQQSGKKIQEFSNVTMNVRYLF